MTNTIVSLDCESNGLHGQIFAAAAIIYQNGAEVADWYARCPIDGPVDPWVAENVLPAMEGIPVSSPNYGHLLDDWRKLVDGLRPASPLYLAHIPWPVETRFLWDAHGATPFTGPYPLLDLASMLHARGYDATSEDAYLTARGLSRPAGKAHDPRNDARSAALAYFDLLAAGGDA